MAKSPILGGFSSQISPNAADNLAVNLNLEVIETKDGIVPGFLRGASGLDLIGSLGSFVLTGGEIGSGGSGYAPGDIVYLLPGNGTWTTAPAMRVTMVVGGSITGFEITAPGSFTMRSTNFTQQATSGTGSGFSLILPSYDTGGPIRGLLPLNDILYIVSGPEVWSLTPNGIATLLSTPTNQLSEAGTPVSMFRNTTQLMIVDGVDAWLVPGGYPLTVAVIDNGGGLYAINDTITMQAPGGGQSAYPVVRVTATSHQGVALYRFANLGTAYTTGLTATVGIQPNPGTGTGLTLDMTAPTGVIESVSVNFGGTGYGVNNTGAITGGGAQDAVYLVTGVSGGAVTSLILLNRGSGYGTGTAVATTATVGNMKPNGGVGLVFSVTAAGGLITDTRIQNAGQGYVAGNYGYLTAGSGDATYIVDTVSPNGSVTGIEIISPGAINDQALTYSQRTTSGSGSGFTLKTPTYGAFVALVPITVPFPQPIVGATTDGFGVLVFRGRQEIAASAQGDLSTWPPLSYGLANQSPDNCMSVSVNHNQVFVLKENNTEIWVDQGTAPFPLAPLPSAHIQFGCMASYSVAKANSELIWLSRNSQGEGVVVEARGYTPVPISTQALVNEFQTYPNIGDAIAYARQEGQHVYYVLTFPEANKTWQYDKTSSSLAGFPVWTQLAALPENHDGELNRHWGNAFTPWTGTIALEPTVTTYQPLGVTITLPTELDNDALGGLPASFDNFVLSLWLDMPDDAPHGIIFTNQDDETLGSTNPGLFIRIQNDAMADPQLIIAAWDVGNAPILYATYEFFEWSDWVNVQISVGSTSNRISVYANTFSGGLPVESHLSGSVTWSSTAPMANPGGHTWRVIPVG